MKIIALIPFRNEDWILEACLSSLRPWVDEIIGCDDRSTDQSASIFERYGGIVVAGRTAPGTDWDVFRLRQLLLEEGRARDGTHFICLDADEAITSHRVPVLKNQIAQMKPGHKLRLQWLALWKNSRQYRDDASVWSNNYKDFIFCDDGSTPHDRNFLCEGRTPGPNLDEQTARVPPDVAAVLHFQFVPWNRFQMKQAWYRCLELIHAPGSSRIINAKYKITLDDSYAQCVTIPPQWVAGLRIPDAIEELPASWHRDEVLAFFDRHGIEFFVPLEIWHIPELASEFEKRTQRRPRNVKLFEPLRKLLRLD